MNYAQTMQQQAVPKSERAASKAPVYNQQEQHQQQPHQTRHPSPPTSNGSGRTTTRSAAAAPAVTASPNPGPTAAQKGKANANKLWSTNSTEECERIKYFWLGLGKQERRNLVKIEKETVLQKFKSSCSCAVCGRKWFVFFFFLNYINHILSSFLYHLVTFAVLLSFDFHLINLPSFF